MSQDRMRRSDVLAAYEDHMPGPRKTGPLGFVLPVIVVGILGAIGLFLYKGRVETVRAAEEKVAKARRKLRKHDLASLREAERLYKETLELIPGDEKAVAGLALTYFQQSQHGLSTLGASKDYLAQAESANTVSSERYATRAYIDIVEGRPEKAERDIKTLLEQELGDARTAHALGWARAAQGDWVEGNRIIRQAIDRDFSAVAYRFTLAEIAHRTGNERAAVRQLDSILQPNVNPDHLLAKAWLAALRLKNYGNLTKPVQAISELQAAGALSPKTQGYLAWAEVELQLALMKYPEAQKKLEEATALLPDFPPLVDAEARALVGLKKPRRAIAAFKRAIDMTPSYRGIKWEFARYQSRRGRNAALALVDELERSDRGAKGPEYELFRGDYELRKGDLDAADTHYQKAAELGDDPDILFGLAKVTFERQKKRGDKADLDAVARAIQLALDKKRLFPEAHEYVAGISLWNYQVDSAHNEFEQAEEQIKKLRRPIPEVMAFYERVRTAFTKLDAPQKVRRQAARLAQQWQQKQGEYASSLLTEG